MRLTDHLPRFVLALAAVAVANTAIAGAPLIVDAVSGKPWVYPPGTTTPVYYDVGDYAVVTDWNNYPAQVTFDNATGAAQVRTGFAEWSAIPTSSFRAEVKGDFASIGLPDITGANADLVIGAWNGGGIDVIFDADGTIFQNFFGVGSNVLGISSPEFGDDATGYITESWTVLNGQAISASDANAAHYQGTATHEFGHSLGLAHTQTNGAAYFYGAYTGEPVGPQSCTALPYRTDLSSADIETMYPFQDPTPTNDLGLAQGHIHIADDVAAISDLYPTGGWPGAYASITGRVLDVDGKTPLTGVNVIARNLDDPFADANSSLSGEWTQGQFGPDGSFALHGLRPGARYVIYVDAVVAGGFPTPPLWFLPGAERFYAGPTRGSQPFDPCAYKVITGKAGSVATADIAFERVRGAPLLISLGYGAGASGISGDGSTVVGNYGRGGPAFRWTQRSGVVPMDLPTTGEITSISKNGKFISTNLIDSNDVDLGAFRWDAKNGWIPVAAAGTCGTDTTTSFGVANDGSVYGLAYNSCTDFKTFRWNPRAGTKLYPSATVKGDGTPANGRPNQVSADGSTLVGWEELDWGGRTAVAWVDGKPSEILDAFGQQLNEASAVSGDGTVITGGLFDGQAPLGDGWRKRINRPALEYYAPVSADASPANSYALSREGDVMAGFSGNPWFSVAQAPLLWTKEMGSVDLNQFLKRQGTAFEQYVTLWTPMAMSDDGTVLTGWGMGVQFWAGWVLQMPQVFVCHLEKGERGEGHTQSVPFPKGLDDHLQHGDAVGPCPNHQE